MLNLSLFCLAITFYVPSRALYTTNFGDLFLPPPPAETRHEALGIVFAERLRATNKYMEGEEQYLEDQIRGYVIAGPYDISAVNLIERNQVLYVTASRAVLEQIAALISSGAMTLTSSDAVVRSIVDLQHDPSPSNYQEIVLHVDTVKTKGANSAEVQRSFYEQIVSQLGVADARVPAVMLDSRKRVVIVTERVLAEYLADRLQAGIYSLITPDGQSVYIRSIERGELSRKTQQQLDRNGAYYPSNYDMSSAGAAPSHREANQMFYNPKQ